MTRFGFSLSLTLTLLTAASAAFAQAPSGSQASLPEAVTRTFVVGNRVSVVDMLIDRQHFAAFILRYAGDTVAHKGQIAVASTAVGEEAVFD